MKIEIEVSDALQIMHTLGVSQGAISHTQPAGDDYLCEALHDAWDRLRVAICGAKRQQVPTQRQWSHLSRIETAALIEGARQIQDQHKDVEYVMSKDVLINFAKRCAGPSANK